MVIGLGQFGMALAQSLAERNVEVMAVDALLEKGRASCRREDRVKTYHRIQEILAEDLPMLFLYVRDALPVVSSRVHGPDPGPAGMMWNLHEWYVPKSLQVYTAG